VSINSEEKEMEDYRVLRSGINTEMIITADSRTKAYKKLREVINAKLLLDTLQYKLVRLDK